MSIFSPDGQIVSIERDLNEGDPMIHYDSTLKAPSIHAVLRFSNMPDRWIGQVREGIARQLSSRSGQAQIGIDLKVIDEPEIQGSNVDLKVALINLNRELPNMLQAFQMEDRVGRLMALDPDKRVKKEEVNEIISSHILLAENFDVEEDDQGAVLVVQPEDLEFIFDYKAINQLGIAQKNDLMMKGRAGTYDFVTVNRGVNGDRVESNGLFIGAIKLSLGDYDAVIETETNPEGTHHLAAVGLDAFRSQGLRQIEIYNNNRESIPIKDLRLKIKLYRSENHLKVPVSKQILEGGGYQVHDNEIMPVSLLSQAMKLVGTQASDGRPFAYVAASGRAKQIDFTSSPRSQNTTLVLGAQELIHSHSEDFRPQNQTLQEVSERLGLIGGTKARLLVSRYLPDAQTINQLRGEGIGAIIFEYTDMPKEAHSRSAHVLPQTLNNSRILLNARQIRDMIDMSIHEQPRMQFYMLHPTRGLLVFHRGVFTEVEKREKFDNISYWFSFYGTSKPDIVDKASIQKFLEKLKVEHGEQVGVIHGSNTGMMQEVDDVAAAAGVFRTGISEDLSTIGQAFNSKPDAIIRYSHSERSARQGYMDWLGNFPIFEKGGIGTNEEFGITLTSLKACEKMPVPLTMIGDWSKVVQQIRHFTAQGLAPKYIQNLICLPDSYEEAFETIQNFISDPGAWYAERQIPPDVIERSRHGVQKKLDLLGLKAEKFES